MNKIETNIKYKMSYQFAWVAWSLTIYLIMMFLVFYFLIKFSLINLGEGSLVYRLWVLIIFQFAISMRFKEDFDLFLILSNTRNDIFYSLLGVAFGFSAFFSGLIVLERLFVDYLNNIFGYHNIVDPFHFFAPYGSVNIYLQFVFFLVFSFCCSVFGLLIGSLSYRFGKKFTLAFWLIFSAIPVMFFPWLFWHGQVSIFITDAGGFLQNFDVLVGSGYLFILTIVFSIATYLNIRRLPQK